MDKGKSSDSFLPDISTAIASLLPVLQLLLVYLPSQIKNIYLAPKSFIGVSIVTLILSYVFIVSVNTNPFSTITLPLQRKKKAKYDEYIRLINEASSVKQFVLGEQPSTVKINEFLENIEKDPVPPPFAIRPNNRISICLSILTISTLTFVILGQLNYSLLWAIVQSVSYIILIVSAVLILTLYRINTLNNKRFQRLQVQRTTIAIELAISNNCFAKIPQVSFITCFEEPNFGNYHVWAEYENKKYEIITDNSATKLIKFTEINI
jgi:hypothetical protein